jgi:hypothetical protein
MRCWGPGNDHSCHYAGSFRSLKVMLEIQRPKKLHPTGHEVYCGRCGLSVYYVCSFQWPLLAQFLARFYGYRKDASQGIEWCEDTHQTNPFAWLFFRASTIKYKQNYPFSQPIVVFLPSITKCSFQSLRRNNTEIN